MIELRYGLSSTSMPRSRPTKRRGRHPPRHPTLAVPDISDLCGQEPRRWGVIVGGFFSGLRNGTPGKKVGGGGADRILVINITIQLLPRPVRVEYSRMNTHTLNPLVNMNQVINHTVVSVVWWCKFIR